MADPFLSEIRMFSFNFAPRGWATCDGQLLPINQNQALFALLGTTYGGNGQTTFALPNLQGRAAIHRGPGAGTATQQGESGGVESVTLTTSQLPAHQHSLNVVTDFANSHDPANALPAARPRGGLAIYGPASSADSTLNPQVVALSGGNQAHYNMQPYNVLNFCIAISGIFPSRN